MPTSQNGWEPTPHSSAQRVLFIDDDPLMQRAVRRHLASHGVEIIAVAFQSHVEPLLAAGPYDAVLCDYHLGDRATSTPLVRRLTSEHHKVAVLTSDPEGARADTGLDGIPVFPKSDFDQVLAWLRQPREPPDKPSHERLKAQPPAEPTRPAVSKLAIEAPAVPRSATPVELAAYEEMELPDPRDAQAPKPASTAPDAPTREMPSAPRLRAVEPPAPASTQERAPMPAWVVFMMGAGVGGGAVAAALWLAGALG